jgi:hypothetical protein
MNVIRLLPVLLSILLLGAHFFRAGDMVLVIVVLSGIIILLIPRPWAARIIQIGLVIGGIEWIRTLVNLVKLRQAMGASWHLLVLILGPVAVLTICSSLVFKLKALKKRYRLE